MTAKPVMGPEGIDGAPIGSLPEGSLSFVVVQAPCTAQAGQLHRLPSQTGTRGARRPCPGAKPLGQSRRSPSRGASCPAGGLRAGGLRENRHAWGRRPQAPKERRSVLTGGRPLAAPPGPPRPTPGPARKQARAKIRKRKAMNGSSKAHHPRGLPRERESESP